MDLRAYIGDFGMSRTSDPDQKDIDCEGDRRFLDPLIFTGAISTYSDIYSFGLVGLCILECIPNLELFLSNLKVLLDRCLSLEVKDRPSLVDIKNVLQNLINIT